MSDDAGRKAAISALEAARAVLERAASSPDLRRALGTAIAEIDRASATIEPAAPGSFSLTARSASVPQASSLDGEALRRDAERFRAIAEQGRGLLNTVLTQSPHGVIVCDAQGKLILQNRASERIWAGSATAETVEGWGQYRAFHADGRPYQPGDWSMARCLSQGSTIEAEEVHFQRFDGTHGVLLGSCAPIFDELGQLTGAVSVFADITHFKQVEDALRVSEAWLSTTLRSIGDAVIATDTSGRVRFMNPVAESLTGWTIAEARGRALGDVFRVFDKVTRGLVESPVERVLREGSVVGLPARSILGRRDGSEIAIDDSGAPIRSDRGELIGVVIVFRDMTEKDLAEERRELLVEASRLLASSRVDYESTLASLAHLAVPRLAVMCAVDVIETEGSLSRLALAFVRGGEVEVVERLGPWYPPEPDVSWGVHNVVHTGRAEVHRQVDEAMLSAIVRDPEYIARIRGEGVRCLMIVPMRAHQRALGAITFISAGSMARPSHAAGGYGPDELALAEEIASRAAIAMDNALLYREARRAEAEAYSHAARMNRLAEISRAFGEAGIELSGVLATVARCTADVLCDGCVVRLLSEGGGELDPVALHHTDPEMIPFVRDVLAARPINAGDGLSGQALKTGAPIVIEGAPAAFMMDVADLDQKLDLDRSGIHSVVVAPLRAAGSAIGTLTVFRDRDSRAFSEEDRVLVQEVADRAALAIENARFHEHTRDAALAREELLAIVSHDLRNPLNVVMMNSAILLRGAGQDKAGEQLKKHAEKILRSAERMRSLIADLLDATRVQSGRIPVDLRPLDLGALVGESLDMLKELAAPKGQRLTRDVEAGIPLVACDRERVLQLLGNLVGNAIKFTPEGGGIAVRVGQSDGNALVSVRDTGPGIPDDYIPHIFERYWRGKRDAHAGTGLGLYIAKGIVEAHRGRIWLESRLGQGSTFFFTIPFYREGHPTSQRSTPPPERETLS